MAIKTSAFTNIVSKDPATVDDEDDHGDSRGNQSEAEGSMGQGSTRQVSTDTKYIPVLADKKEAVAKDKVASNENRANWPGRLASKRRRTAGRGRAAVTGTVVGRGGRWRWRARRTVEENTMNTVIENVVWAAVRWAVEEVAMRQKLVQVLIGSLCIELLIKILVE